MKRMIPGAAVLLALAGVVFWLCSRRADNVVEAAQEKKMGTEFAADRDGPASAIPFDGKRAMKYLEEICALGPRMSGTEQMKAQQDLIKKHFAAFDCKVEAQTFSANNVKLSLRLKQRAQLPGVAVFGFQRPAGQFFAGIE